MRSLSGACEKCGGSFCEGCGENCGCGEYEFDGKIAIPDLAKTNAKGENTK